MGIIDSGIDITKLISGAARVLYAPTSVAIPTNIADILLMESPYTVQTGWVDFGATTGAASYSRSMESEGLSIEQTAGNVFEDITDVGRSIKFPMGELKPENLQILENAPAIGTIAAASSKSAQKSVKFGSISAATQYRIAIIGQRPLSAGTVTESPALDRGRLLVQCLYRCTISADEASVSFGKGQLGTADISFTAYPEPSVAANIAHGTWLDETAGTIA